jgi:hypothetical protein
MIYAYTLGVSRPVPPSESLWQSFVDVSGSWTLNLLVEAWTSNIAAGFPSATLRALLFLIFFHSFLALIWGPGISGLVWMWPG